MRTRPLPGVPSPPPGVLADDFDFAGLGEWWRKMSIPAAVASAPLGGGGVPPALAGPNPPAPNDPAIPEPSKLPPSDGSLPPAFPYVEVELANIDARALAADSSNPVTSVAPSRLAPAFFRSGSSGGGRAPYESDRRFFLSGEEEGENCPPEGSRRFRSGDVLLLTGRREAWKLTTAERVEEMALR